MSQIENSKHSTNGNSRHSQYDGLSRHSNPSSYFETKASETSSLHEPISLKSATQLLDTYFSKLGIPADFHFEKNTDRDRSELSQVASGDWSENNVQEPCTFQHRCTLEVPTPEDENNVDPFFFVGVGRTQEEAKNIVIMTAASKLKQLGLESFADQLKKTKSRSRLRSYAAYTWRARLFLAITVLEGIAGIILGSYFISNNVKDTQLIFANSSDDLIYNSLIISSVFLTYFAWDAVIWENSSELKCFIFARTMITVYVIFSVIFVSDDRNIDRIVFLLVLVIINFLYILLALHVIKDFGWVAFGIGGTSIAHHELVRIYQLSVAIIKLALYYGIDVGVEIIYLWQTEEKRNNLYIYFGVSKIVASVIGGKLGERAAFRTVMMQNRGPAMFTMYLCWTVSEMLVTVAVITQILLENHFQTRWPTLILIVSLDFLTRALGFFYGIRFLEKHKWLVQTSIISGATSLAVKEPFLSQRSESPSSFTSVA